MKIKEYIDSSMKKTIQECLSNPDFLREYDRLNKTNFSRPGNAINEAIDKATGFKDHQTKQLYEFIRDYVWRPVFIGSFGDPSSEIENQDLGPVDEG